MNAHPDRIAGAVLLEPGEFSTELGTKMESGGVNILSEALNDFLWSRQFFFLSDHELADYLYIVALGDPAYGEARHNDPSPNWRISASVLQYLYFEELVDGTFDFTKNLGLVEPEVLFIAGGLSTEMGKEFQKHQAALFQKSRIEVIESYLASLDLSGAVKWKKEY